MRMPRRRHYTEGAIVSSVMTRRIRRRKLAPKNDLAALQLSASKNRDNRGCACAAGVRDGCRLRNPFNSFDDGTFFRWWFRVAGDGRDPVLLDALARPEGACGQHHDETVCCG